MHWKSIPSHTVSSLEKFLLHLCTILYPIKFLVSRRPSFADIKTYLSEIHMEERERFEEQSKMETRRIQAMSWGSNGSDEDLPPPKVITMVCAKNYLKYFI